MWKNSRLKIVCRTLSCFDGGCRMDKWMGVKPDLRDHVPVFQVLNNLFLQPQKKCLKCKGCFHVTPTAQST
jgi:hypothetical protein